MFKSIESTTENSFMLIEKTDISEADYKSNSMAYLLDEFEKIRLVLLLTVHQFRSNNLPRDDALTGFFISDGEIDYILERNIPASNKDKQVEILKASIKDQEDLITRKLTQCEANGIALPITHLKNCFNLTKFEADILLICLSSLYNMGYEKVFAYLQNDASQKHLSIQLIDRMFTETFEECCRNRDSFSTHMPLLKWRMLKTNEGQYRGPFLPSMPLVIDDRIAAFLTGSSYLDSGTSLCLSVLESYQTFDELLLEEDLKLRLKNLTDYFRQPLSNGINHIITLYGPSGSGKKHCAAIVAKSINRPLLSLRLAPILNDYGVFRETVTRVIREILILGAGLLIEDFDLLSVENKHMAVFRDYLLEHLQDYCWLCFLISSNRDSGPGQLVKARDIRLHFPIPKFSLRVEIWNRVLKEQNISNLMTSSSELANRFKFNESQIRNAIATAQDDSFSRLINGKSILEEDLLMGCWGQCNQELSKLAQKIDSKSCWDDLILPQEQSKLLQEVCSHFKYKNVVYSQWGFNEKVLYGKGLSILFSGPSGTGKTMAAGIIAHDLKLELYKIDLSTVVSKYIGETEKNLSRIFNEAETSNAILFFDEADALFGKRSEITNAHDRYANIETSYLLQKMEEYEGITILASNLRQNLDQAFLRRMQFIIEFPFPDKKLRERLWKGIFPVKAPLETNIDYDFLASRLKLSGGNIKNIAIGASFFAAEENSNIEIRHIMLAAKREYVKLGMSFLKSDMSPYIELIERGI